MKKISKIALYVLMGISLIITVLYFIYKGDKGSATLDTWTYAYLDWAYIMLAIAILLIIVLPILTIKERKINFKRIILLVVGVVVVLGAAYLLAPGTTITLANGTVAEGMTTKLTDTGIFVAYFLLAAAVLSIIFGSVYNAVRKD